MDENINNQTGSTQTKLNPLEKSLLAAITSSDKIGDFYMMFKDSEILVLGQGREEKPDAFYLRYIEYENQVTIPVFSSLFALKQYIDQESSYSAISVQELLAIADPSASLLLNPGTTLTKLFVKKELEMLRTGEIIRLFQGK
ncbi:SseB family protein [Mesobacillus zeae]|uniref:SseB family protein n=1 Tax=Mesobacillus zeae TaxID=1917180 RepID=UPI0015E65CA5|nr:SseB family protein [Mesobacillus zeae]